MRLVVDVGATKTLMVAFGKERQVLSERQFPTDKIFEDFVNHLISEAKSTAHQGDGKLEAMALAIPGVIDHTTKRIITCGNEDWVNADIVNRLEYALSTKVIIENDAKLGAIGEARLGAGQQYRTVLYITVSTGIGIGVTVDGQLDPALRKSEAGFMQLTHDSQLIPWERFASGKAFRERFGQYGRDVSDPAIWKQYASDIAVGIINLAAIIQPDVIIIGGSMGEHFSKYSQFLEEDLRRLKQSATTVELPSIVAAKDPSRAVINGGIEVIDDYLHKE